MAQKKVIMGIKNKLEIERLELKKWMKIDKLADKILYVVMAVVMIIAIISLLRR